MTWPAATAPLELAPLPADPLARATAGPVGKPLSSDRETANRADYRQSLEVQRGDTLIALMTRAGAERGEAEQAIQAMKSVYNPRRIKPGQTVHLAFLAVPEGHATAPEGGASALGYAAAAGGSLVGLRLELGPERVIQVSRTTLEQDFEAEAIERPLTRSLAGRSGRIASSLFVSGEEAGVPTAVMIELIRAFSFDVDFQREIWKGDGFELLYETYHDATGAFVKRGDLLYAALELQGERLELYRFTPKNGRSDYFDPDGQSARRTLMRTPIDGARISSGYGRRRHPVLGYTRVHRGVDFAAPRGTPIYAAGDGVIELAGRKGAYGRYIRIRHNSTYKTAYAHLRGYAKGIRKGRRVKQGQVIGYVGTSGRSTGPHLHYEVHVNGRQTNPLRVKLPSGQKLQGEDLVAFAAARREIDELRGEQLRRRFLTERPGELAAGLP